MITSYFRSFTFHPLPPSFPTVQTSVTDNISCCITQSPSIATRFPFHIDAFLFAEPPDPVSSHKCHEKFTQQLKTLTKGNVFTVDTALNSLDKSTLSNILLNSANPRFLIEPSAKITEVSQLLTIDYIEKSISRLSKSDLVDLILLNPKIFINIDKSCTGFSFSSIPISPMSNLTFTRDQQIATPKGVVIGNFRSRQRRSENELMSQLLPLIGIHPIGRIEHPGVLDGGDYISVNKDLSILAVGNRTNFEAATQLMDNDLLGTRRLLVIEGKKENQYLSNLDSMLSIVNENEILCVDAIYEDVSYMRRTVREFIKREEDGKYIEEKRISFGSWLRKEKFVVHPIGFSAQQRGFLSFLNLGRDLHGRIQLMSSQNGFEKYVKAHGIECDVISVDLDSILTMGTGGANGLTFCLRKTTVS